MQLSALLLVSPLAALVACASNPAVDAGIDAASDSSSGPTCTYPSCSGTQSCPINSVCDVGDGCNQCRCLSDGGAPVLQCTQNGCTCDGGSCKTSGQTCGAPSECCSHLCDTTFPLDGGPISTCR